MAQHYPEHPNGQGFDEFYGFCGGVWFDYFDAELENNGEKVKSKGYITDVLTDKAIDFIKDNRERPFFCYVPYNAPHTPCLVPDSYFDKYSKKGFDTRTSAIYGMIENIDDNFRRILDTLDSLDIAEDTIVIFMTDNGPNGKRYNAGMRGTKASVDEGGVRVPMFVRWPGHIEPGTIIKENAAHIDLMPTIADLCNVPMGETLPLDGISVKSLLTNEAKELPDRMIFTFPSPREITPNIPGAVRTRQWRATKRKGNWSLYNMSIDPAQEKNVAEEHPEVLARLSAAYEETFEEITQDGIDPLPIQVGHPEWSVVTLPGHEAHLKPANGEGIVYNYKPGYTGHWIANWTEIGSYPLWDIQVVRAGLYEVTLMYTCKQEDVGTKIRVEVGGESLESVVQDAYDPAPIPVPFRLEDERVKYMSKVWKPLKMGRILLDKGHKQLIVRATHIPGTRAIDLKDVQLRRV
ncbi:sulfatase-like hydrolase/transferase [Candidatus Poribacteria bacterium]